MRKLLSILLAVVLVASVAVMAVGAADADTAADAAGTATVTLFDVKGESVTQTYSVGETFTTYVYLNTAAIDPAGIGSMKGLQTYDSDILELKDAYNKEGLVSKTTEMLPVCGSGAVANAGTLGLIQYNASIPGYDGFQFNTDDALLIVTHYTVKAAGNAIVNNTLFTLAVSDYELTRIVDKGVVVKDGFTSRAVLSAPAAPVGSTVSGTVTSYLDDAQDVTVQILDGETVIGSDVKAGNTVSYSISNVANGDYTLRVSKKNHVTRDYAITVSGDTSVDAKICPLGDATGDGKITILDVSTTNNHFRHVKDLTGYALQCADVTKDGKISILDISQINNHFRTVKSLWVD